MPTTDRTRRSQGTQAPKRTGQTAAAAKKKLRGLSAATTTPAKKKAARTLAAGRTEAPAASPRRRRTETIVIELPTRPNIPDSTPTGTIQGPPSFIERAGGAAAWAALGESLRHWGDEVRVSNDDVKDAKRSLAKILGLDIKPEQFQIAGRGDAFSLADGFPWVDVQLLSNPIPIQLNMESGETKWRTGGFAETFPIDEGARQFARHHGLRMIDGRTSAPSEPPRVPGGSGFFDPQAVSREPQIGDRGWFADYQKSLDSQTRLMGDPAESAMRAVLPKLNEHFSAATGEEIKITIGKETARMRSAVAGAVYQVLVSRSGGPFEVCQGELYLGDHNSHIGASASKLAGDLYSAVKQHLGRG